MNPVSLLPDLPAGARILILRLRSIGDIILLTPTLRLLKEWRPDLRISVMVESRFRELLQGNPAVEEILIPGEGTGARNLLSRLAVIRELRGRGFSLCMNLHGGPTSRLFTRWSGARWRVGFAHYRGASLYNILIPDARTILNQPSLHTAEHQAAAFFYLGLPRTDIPRAQIFSGEAQSAWWDAKRDSLGIAGGEPYAIVHPTASYKTKEWSAEGFARIGDYLASKARITPIYSCGPGETSVLDAVEKASGAPVRRLEGVSLAQFAAAVAGARLFVGNDSGPAHMAAALARPVVVIFGSSSSPIWGPWPQQSSNPAARIVQNPFDCNPCPGDHCYKFVRPECILSVTFDQVKDAVEKVLAQTV
ncbi:MAG: glycosyltransferase family 9 protein [Acidobacteriota bacterium]|nr:glycosyltransferase family 9 protein [Acidobacteriota bacterium]